MGVSMDDAISDCELGRESAEAAGDPQLGSHYVDRPGGTVITSAAELSRSAEMFRAAIREFQQVGNSGGVGGRHE